MSIESYFTELRQSIEEGSVGKALAELDKIYYEYSEDEDEEEYYTFLIWEDTLRLVLEEENMEAAKEFTEAEFRENIADVREELLIKTEIDDSILESVCDSYSRTVREMLSSYGE